MYNKFYIQNLKSLIYLIASLIFHTLIHEQTCLKNLFQFSFFILIKKEKEFKLIFCL
jgi:hypothetical protein